MSKELVLGTIHKYDWVQLGAAIHHPEIGKIVDVNDDVREKTGVEDASLKIYTSNGYGDIHTLRKIINDPVHGFITINDPLVFEIIKHPFYQRLFEYIQDT